MSGNYTHTTRPQGTVITHTIYNEDHQKHIDNGIATSFGGLSTTSALLQTVQSPGDVGSEAVTTSLTEDFRQLRYVIQQIKQSTYWYTRSHTRTVALPGYLSNKNTNSTAALALDDAGETIMLFTWVVPPGWTGTDGTITLITRALSGCPANAVIRWRGASIQEGGTRFSMLLPSTQQIVSYATDGHLVHTTFALGNGFAGAVGYSYLFVVGRHTNDANDTLAAGVEVFGALLTYETFAGAV